MTNYYQRYKKRGVAKSDFTMKSGIKPTNDTEVGGIFTDTSNVNETEDKTQDTSDIELKSILESSRVDAQLKSKTTLGNLNKKTEPPKENKEIKVKSDETEMNKEEFHVMTAKSLVFKDIPSNLAQSLVAWTKSGRSVVNSTQWSTRLKVCRSCSYWSENKNTNIAKCMKCGCGSGKLLLSGSKCPLNPPKWDSL